MGTWRSLVISLVVLLAVVLVVMALTPRPARRELPAVDAMNKASAVVKDTGWSVLMPTLPQGWVATAVSYQRDSIPPAYSVTYHYGDDQQVFMTLKETVAGSAQVGQAWAQAQFNGSDAGWQSIGGPTWQVRRQSGQDRTALVRVADSPSGVSVVLYGNASLDQLVSAANSLVKVDAAR